MLQGHTKFADEFHFNCCNFKISVFWFVESFGLINVYQRFRGYVHESFVSIRTDISIHVIADISRLVSRCVWVEVYKVEMPTEVSVMIPNIPEIIGNV